MQYSCDIYRPLFKAPLYIYRIIINRAYGPFMIMPISFSRPSDAREIVCFRPPPDLILVLLLEQHPFCVRMAGGRRCPVSIDSFQRHKYGSTGDCAREIPLRKITSYTLPSLLTPSLHDVDDAVSGISISAYYFCFLENGSGYVPGRPALGPDFHEYSLADTNALYKYVLKPRISPTN